MFRLIIVLGLVHLTLSAPAILSANQVGHGGPRPYGVPEASLPCTPEEQAWWNELRDAADNLRSTRRPGDKHKKHFANALHDGQAKSYKPPIPDARPVILFKTEPTYTDVARDREVNGSITLELELRSDGSVGKIKLLQGLGSGLDESAADAARKTIFLPAVKNREFVTSTVRMIMNFNVY